MVYQIYPRSFQDSNGDGIGDLPGITSRLNHLSDLGVDAVWISPFFKSPNADNGYDISDYRDIMTEFGTLEDFKLLAQGLKKRNIKLIMDLVVNHSSDEHPWFLESKQSRDNPKADYYIWKDADEKGNPPNDWTSVFSGPAWSWSEERQQYYLHIFTEKQPDLNWRNPELRREIYDMMKYWLDLGVDGFRLDVINHISKHFKDEGAKEDVFYMGPDQHEFLREMNRQVLSQGDILSVGECPGATPEDAIDFSAPDRQELSMIFTFEHVELDRGPGGKWDVGSYRLADVKANLSKWQEALHGKGWNSLYLSNHDQPRMVSRLGIEEKHRPAACKMLASFSQLLEGTPYIYQGEELGMTSLDWQSPTEMRDVESINAWQDLVVERQVMTPEAMMAAVARIGRDNARTPMQWSPEPGAGFSDGQPWLRINANHKTINARAEKDNPDSVFHYYKKLIALRKELPVMVYGKYVNLSGQRPDLWAWERVFGKERLVVINNLTDQDLPINLDDYMKAKEFTMLLGNYQKNLPQSSHYDLKPYESLIFFNEPVEEALIEEDEEN